MLPGIGTGWVQALPSAFAAATGFLDPASEQPSIWACNHGPAVPLTSYPPLAIRRPVRAACALGSKFTTLARCRIRDTWTSMPARAQEGFMPVPARSDVRRWAFIASATASSKSSKGHPPARSRARSFPMTLRRPASATLRSARRGPDHWSWTRNVAEILAFSPAKPQSSPSNMAGSSGVLRYIRQAHGLHNARDSA